MQRCKPGLVNIAYRNNVCGIYNDLAPEFGECYFYRCGVFFVFFWGVGKGKPQFSILIKSFAGFSSWQTARCVLFPQKLSG